VVKSPVSQSIALAVAAKAPASPPVLAVTDIIRSAADQASATWKTAALPSQRRESPATPFRMIAPPASAPASAPPTAPAAASAEASPTVESPAAAASADTVISPAVVVPTELEAAVSAATDAATDASTDAGNGSAVSGPAAPSSTSDEDAHWPGARRQIAVLVIVVCVLLLAVLLGHRYLPDFMGFGSLIDTFLPWIFVPLALALPAALLSLKKWAIGICLLTCAVWAGDFGPTLMRSGGSGPADIRVLSQNVSVSDSGTTDLSGIALLAQERGADIVVLQGLSKNTQSADQQVPARFGYHMAMYEFVVWSRFPIGAVQPVDLAGGRPAEPGQESSAAMVQATSGQFGGLLRFTVDAGQGRQVTVYAVHLPQPSLSHDGFGVARGAALEQLVDDVQAEKSPDLIVVGDLDVAQTDRAMGPLLKSGTGLVSAQAKAGSGFGFTWPATFPMVRLDDVLARGLAPVASVVLPAVGPKQAHRPIEADLKF
jgi:vancomycin resistance protein VanJ